MEFICNKCVHVKVCKYVAVMNAAKWAADTIKTENPVYLRLGCYVFKENCNFRGMLKPDMNRVRESDNDEQTRS